MSSEFGYGVCDQNLKLLAADRIAPIGRNWRPQAHAIPADSVMEAGMGNLVNLRKFKKRSAREQSEKQAAANRTQFGRTKSERISAERNANRANDLLDQHRIDGGDAS